MTSIDYREDKILLFPEALYYINMGKFNKNLHVIILYLEIHRYLLQNDNIIEKHFIVPINHLIKASVLDRFEIESAFSVMNESYNNINIEKLDNNDFIKSVYLVKFKAGTYGSLYMIDSKDMNKLLIDDITKEERLFYFRLRLLDMTDSPLTYRKIMSEFTYSSGDVKRLLVKLEKYGLHVPRILTI